jgi:hypothetical protein
LSRPAKGISAGIGSNSHKPGTQDAASEPANGAVCRDEDLLRHVLSATSVSYDSGRQVQHLRLVSLDYEIEGIQTTVLAADDQF